MGDNMKDLPRVYANPIDKEISNVQETFVDRHLKSDNSISNPKDINRKINEIFASRNHIYKSKVLITYRDHETEETIVGKTNLNLLTMDGRLIRITDVMDIKKI